MNKNKNKMILDLFVFLNQILIELFILNSLFIIYSIPLFIQSHRVIIVFVFFFVKKNMFKAFIIIIIIRIMNVFDIQKKKSGLFLLRPVVVEVYITEFDRNILGKKKKCKWWYLDFIRFSDVFLSFFLLFVCWS